MEKNYCPIKQRGNICGVTNEKCDQLCCWEKLHYGKLPREYRTKMEKWRSHRRKEVRWKDKS